MNEQRKLLCDQVFQGAQAQLEQDRNLHESPVIVLSHPAWPAGVIGIVASRLVELYHRRQFSLPPAKVAWAWLRAFRGRLEHHRSHRRAGSPFRKLWRSPYGGRPVASHGSAARFPTRLGEDHC